MLLLELSLINLLGNESEPFAPNHEVFKPLLRMWGFSFAE